MEHEVSFLYILLKPLLDGLPEGLAFLNADHVVLVTFFTAVLLICLPLVAGRLKQNGRGGLQQTLEVAFSAIRGLVRENVHKSPDRHVGIIASLALIVLLFNLAGAFPLFSSLSPNMNVTLALALTSFLYYNYQGIKQHGPWGYTKTFMGPMPAIAPLMLVSELISHLARILSLSLRLTASMSADHIVVGAFTLLFPFVLPFPMVGLGLLMAGVQTFIFVLLSTIYIGAAVSEEH